MRDFRGVRDCTVQFEPRLTVLIGRNGVGKTALLDCLHLLFDSLYMSLDGPAALITVRRSEKLLLSRNANPSDVSAGHREMSCAVAFSARWPGKRALETYQWQHQVKTNQRDGLAREVNLPENHQTVKRLFSVTDNPATDLPLTVHYRVDRANLEGAAPPIADPQRADIFNAYSDSLGTNNATFRWFGPWFREREDAENAEIARLGAPGWRRPSDPQLEAVRRAVLAFLPGFSDLHIDRTGAPRLAIRKDGVVLMVDQLSDGERGLLALVGDLARRLAMSAPDRRSDALAQPGWVFIDEIELHLHPAWQRDILTRLSGAFPNCQFIVTTHSPLVLADVPAANVRVLSREADNLVVRTPLSPTKGRDSNAILADVMGTAERPDAEREELRRIAELIDSDRLQDARKSVDRLAKVLTDRDAEIVRLRTTIEFLTAP